MAKKKGPKKPAEKTRKPKKKKGKGGFLTVLITALFTVIAGIILLSYLNNGIIKKEKTPEPVPPPVSVKEEPKEDTKEINIYISDEEGLNLKTEKANIKMDSLEAEVKEALNALMNRDGEERTIPEGTKLLGLKIKNGTAIVDLSKELSSNHTGGSSAETQTVYSIVDTVTLNFPEIKDVRILIEGKTEKTIAGHIDISYPIGPDRKIIKN